MKKLKIALWSLGKHAHKNIIPSLLKSTKIEIIGIYSRDPHKFGLYSDRFLIYKNPEDMLEDDQVDAVYISSPNSLHDDQVRQCVISNKHVIVEKTSFTNIENAKISIGIANKSNLVIMEAFMYKYHKLNKDLLKIISSNDYGNLIFGISSFCFPHLDKDNIRYKEDLGGGALNDAGAYTIALAKDILGKNIELNFAHIDHKDYPVDISGCALFTNSSANIFCKWGFGIAYRNSIELNFEKGNLFIDRAFSKPYDYEAIIKLEKDGEISEFISGEDNHFINMFDYFYELVDEKKCSAEYENILSQLKLLDEVRFYGK